MRLCATRPSCTGFVLPLTNPRGKPTGDCTGRGRSIAGSGRLLAIGTFCSCARHALPTAVQPEILLRSPGDRFLQRRREPLCDLADRVRARVLLAVDDVGIADLVSHPAAFLKI